MTDFTVEVTTAAIADGDWSTLRRVIDLIPGTLLIEDPTEPTLVMPVDAETPARAALFVDGVAALVGFTPLTGAIYPAPAVDFNVDEPDGGQPAETEAVTAVREWVQDVPLPRRHVAEDGSLSLC